MKTIELALYESPQVRILNMDLENALLKASTGENYNDESEYDDSVPGGWDWNI